MKRGECIHCGNTWPESEPDRCPKCEVTGASAGSAPRVLKLTLKRQWFDMIASGEKREEYRTPGKWINSRIHGKEYDVIEFKNGYGANVPTMIVEYKGWREGFGIERWGAEGGKVYAIIDIGAVLSSDNAQEHLPR